MKATTECIEMSSWKPQALYYKYSVVRCLSREFSVRASCVCLLGVLLQGLATPVWIVPVTADAIAYTA